MPANKSAQPKKLATKTAAKPASTTRAPARKPAAPAVLTPAQLLAKAMATHQPPETIAQIIGFVERDRQLAAEQAFIGAMLAFKTNDLPEILRNATGVLEGDHGEPIDYDYATLDRLCECLIPALVKHGIVHSYETPATGAISESGLVRITAILSHELGHRERATLEAAPDTTNGKNAVQAIGSTATYLQRYTLLLVCGVAVKQKLDDDGRAGARPGAAAGQAQAGGQGERRLQPRQVTYVTQGQHPINGPDLTRAIGNIKASRYTYQQLIECYALTRPQLEQVHADLGMPAPSEEVPA